jgi:hypothetical protein
MNTYHFTDPSKWIGYGLAVERILNRTSSNYHIVYSIGKTYNIYLWI